MRALSKEKFTKDILAYLKEEMIGMTTTEC